MAKVLSLEETTAQWCQIREGEPTAETHARRTASFLGIVWARS
jgi:hypothetical protein